MQKGRAMRKSPQIAVFWFFCIALNVCFVPLIELLEYSALDWVKLAVFAPWLAILLLGETAVDALLLLLKG